MLQEIDRPALPLLVFTDLDGTLLDHHDYSFAPAQPALTRLGELRVPLIPTTSKTLAELAILMRALNSPHPCIAENGSLIAYPQDHFAVPDGLPIEQGFCIERLAPSYRDLLVLLHKLRDELEVRFRGFYDMSDAEVAADTGLALDDARRARARLAGEPLIWDDSDAALDAFKAALASHGLGLVRGGRYWHVMAGQSKAKAMLKLAQRYAQVTGEQYTRIALGDSDNDSDMLSAAEIAVIVRRADGSWLSCDGAIRTLRSLGVGPVGWNECMLQLIDEWVESTASSSIADSRRC